MGDLSKHAQTVIDLQSKITPQWLAGFFDGEGCVTAYMANGLMKLEVFVAQSNLLLITAIGIKFGENPRIHAQSAKRICYSIHFTGRGCREFLEYIKDHTIVKRDQVFLALEFLDYVYNSGPSTTTESRNKRLELGGKIRRLNQTIPFGVAVHSKEENVQ